MTRTFVRLAFAAGIFAALTTAASTAHAQEGGRPFGLGIMVGAPAGLTAKYYMDAPFALQFGLGWVDDFDGYHDDGTHASIDAIWHPVILARENSFTLPFYFGVGGRLLLDDEDYDFHCHNRNFCHTHGDEDTRVGVRVPFGLLMDFTRVPFDLYVEAAPTIDLLIIDDNEWEDHDHARFRIDGVLGARFYF